MNAKATTGESQYLLKKNNGWAPLILVVDDDQVSRKIICQVLAKDGFKTIEAENGEQAISMFEDHGADLILLDVMMPVMDGYETCRNLRMKYNDQTLPIVMSTGLDDVSSVEKAFEAGATDFVTKPINWSLLSQRIRYGLRGRDLYLELQEKQQRLAHAQRIAKLGYWSMNLKAHGIDLSEEAKALLGARVYDRISLQDCLAWVHVDDREMFQQQLDNAVARKGPFAFDHRVIRDDGAERIVQQQGEVIDGANGEPELIVAAMQDITERRRAQELIRYQTYYDSLTDLPNRRLFSDRLATEMSAVANNDMLLAVMLIEIDQYKLVLDSLGHSSGDKLIQIIARRLREMQKDNQFLARYSGEHLGLISVNLEHTQMIDEIASEILKRCRQSCTIQNKEIMPTVSIGISIFPIESDDRERLLQDANVARERARESGGNQYRYYSIDMDRKAYQRLDLERGLREALRQQQLVVHYQPQLCARTLAITGCEALVRWLHPEKGLIPPNDFIPVAEDTGLIVDIGEWVLRTACKQASEWHQRGLHRLKVGINLSARQFNDALLIGKIKCALQSSGIQPALVDLEITESIAMDNIMGCIQTLNNIHNLGVSISMDDFGTGYSSLSALNQMPIDTLKIDRAFVKDISANGENGELAEAISAMAKGLKLEVIAEGVETEEQITFLRKSVDMFQGFYFSKPLTAEKFEAFYAEHESQRKLA